MIGDANFSISSSTANHKTFQAIPKDTQEYMLLNTIQESESFDDCSRIETQKPPRGIFLTKIFF